jgi:NitT/TauT family transport system substrate-binding protein
VLPLASAILRSLFAQGEIDGAWVSEPLLSELVQRPDARMLVDEASLWPEGRYPSTLLAVRKPYLDAHPEIALRLVRAHVDEVKWLEAHRHDGLTLSRTAMQARAGRRLSDSVAQAAWGRLRFDADPLAPTLDAAALAAGQEGFLPEASLRGLLLPEPLALARAAPP